MEKGSSSEGILEEEQDYEVNRDVEEPIVLEVGMEFNTAEELFAKFKEYARQKGFPVRKRSSNKDVEGRKTYVRYVCSRAGNRESASVNSVKPRPLSGLGCKVQVSASTDVYGKWQTISLHLDHTHDCSPSKAHLLRCNRQISSREKKEIAIRDQAGIRAPQNFRVGVEEYGGYEKVPYILKDLRNHVDKVRRLRLGKGDATAVRNYFLKMQQLNKEFYFTMSIDDNGQLENVFWADARSRLAYKEFGEVITFDTTYLTNRYDMPFAPFVGVNHHEQSMLLGCGLVTDETTDTFVWLFSTWLACMDGQTPHGIITDQDRAMQKAISIFFPNTTHRWCLWHIMKKCNKKLNGYKDHESIVHDMHRAVYDSQRPVDFERSWNEMVEKYELQENSWLCDLYEERRRWIPCYVKHSFWAGMSTTQRSESMNAFFDGYVDQKTSLKQYVKKYDSDLRSKIEKETQEDCRSFYKMIPLTTSFGVEKQMQSIYTISKFKEFQDQLNAQIYCRTIATQKEETTWVYEILELNERRDNERQQKFIVLYNHSVCEFECSCHLFEYRGIVCKHAIFVLLENDVRSLPDKYILRRWRKDVRRPHSRVTITDSCWAVTAEYKRYNDLCTLFTKIADMVSVDEEDSRDLMNLLKSQEIKLTKRRSQCGSNDPSSKPGDARKVINDVEVPGNEQTIKNPTTSNRKGRSKGRYVGVGEKHSEKAKKQHKAAKKEKQGSGSKKTRETGQGNGCKRIKINDPPNVVNEQEVAPTLDNVSCYFPHTQESTYGEQMGGVSSFINQLQFLDRDTQFSNAVSSMDLGGVYGAPTLPEEEVGLAGPSMNLGGVYGAPTLPEEEVGLSLGSFLS